MRMLLPFFLLMGLQVFSQIKQTAISDTCLFGHFIGKLSEELLYSDANKFVGDGALFFESDNMLAFDGKKFIIQKLSIKGNRKEDKAHGKWEFFQRFATFNQPIFNPGTDAQVRFLTSGIEKRSDLHFNKGLREGKWLCKSTHFENGKINRSETNAFVNYQSGLINGVFVFKFDTPHFGRVAITGKTNNLGFFDGELFIEYDSASTRLKEIRRYEDGYLMGIKVQDKGAKQIINEVVYQDVASLLNKLKSDKPHQLSFQKTETGFGLEFNNGYAPNDLRIVTQNAGNEMLAMAFGFFDTLAALQSTPYSSYNNQLTRRFKYVYPAQEDSLASILLLATNRMLTNAQEVINQPNFELRKASNDSLSFLYAWLNTTIVYLEGLKTELEKFNTNYFDFKRRNIYYQNGLFKLNFPDSVVFEAGKKLVSTNYYPPLVAATFDDLFHNIETYLNQLNKELPAVKNSVNQKLIRSKNQAEINLLDARILYLDDSLLRLYYQKNVPIKNIKNSDETPFYLKVYASTSERLIQPLKNAYLKSNSSYEETAELARKIICKQEFLINSFSSLVFVKHFERQLADSMFVIYRDNPFDNRGLETNILSGIQMASIVLLKHYANNILNAKNCDELMENIENIKRMDYKIRFYVENYQEKPVQMLNKTLRRERVPLRIKRLLDI